METGEIKGLVVRLREERDDASIVALYNEDEGESLPLSVDTYRQEMTPQVGGEPSAAWVAELDWKLTGYAGVGHAWWRGGTDVFQGSIHVARADRRRGIGSALLEHAIVQLRERQVKRLLGWIDVDSDAAQRFTSRHAFSPTGEVMDDYHLNLVEARIEEFAESERRLQREGVRVVSLADLGTDDDGTMRAVQQMERGIEGERPDEGDLADDFPAWQERALHGGGRSADTYWVALDGNRPVGLTFLRRLTPEAAENDFTGVLPDERGRGIASLLKVTTARWGLEHGLSAFYTSHEITNAAMIGINQRLGYRRGKRRQEVARDL